MKKHLISALLLLASASLFAQTDFKISEQMFSRINQNPAGIGNNEQIQLFTATRLQWVGQGVEQTPTSAMLNGHYYCDKIHSGFGLSFVYDELGLANQTINAKLAYAYNVDLGRRWLMSLGLSAGVINKRFDPARHILADPNDPTIPAEVKQTTDFDLDFGFEFSYKYLLIGASATHLPNIGKEVSTTTAPAHINAYLRGNIYLPKKFNLIPAAAYTDAGILNKYVENGTKYSVAYEHVLDFSLTAMYDGKYWFGLGYRGGIAHNDYRSNIMSFMIGFEWHWLRMGYTYDLSISKLMNYSLSTHELMLSFVIPTKYPPVWY